MDTITLNRADIDTLERNYRKVIKSLMCLPDNTPSCAVYLTFGILPFEAQRDLEILGLLGQISVCPDELQNVKLVLKHNLMFYGNNFKGWSTIARKTCQKYGLTDPLDLIMEPWRADRWRLHCKQAVTTHWETKLRYEATEMESLQYLDCESLSLSAPMNIWVRAGMDSGKVKKTTIVSWMGLGIFKTRENLHKMKLVKSDKCLACEKNETENLPHLLLYCDYFKHIREEYLPKLALLNKHFSSIVNNEKMLILSILNPESEMLPAEARLYCETAFDMSRSFCYNIYKKREKFYEIKK